MATLMLFGHGASLAGQTFDFRRPAINAAKIYFWAAEGNVSRVYRDAMGSIIGGAGAIPRGWGQEKSSRIGGALVTDHQLHEPANLWNDPAAPGGNWLSANFNTLANHTDIAALNSTVYHEGATVNGSNIMLLRVVDGGNPILLSTILSHNSAAANFTRALNFAWLVCRV